MEIDSQGRLLLKESVESICDMVWASLPKIYLVSGNTGRGWLSVVAMVIEGPKHF
jgi:hypothetical protein